MLESPGFVGDNFTCQKERAMFQDPADCNRVEALGHVFRRERRKRRRSVSRRRRGRHERHQRPGFFLCSSLFLCYLRLLFWFCFF
jgi:hypothetical protein